MDGKTASVIFELLEKTYPHAGDNPRHTTPPFEALIVTILSAQTTDRSVDEVSGPLFARFPTPEALAGAPVAEVEEIIHRTGFYHMKARRIIDASSVLIHEYGGFVPDTMDALLRIPGVGRKTANIVLYHAFGKTEGVAVDTHVLRLSQMIGFSDRNDAGVVERDLMRFYPSGQWGRITDLLIMHGRRTCIARRPRCPECVIRQYCRYYHQVFLKSAGTGNTGHYNGM
ncbi:MAG: endonuclease III [Methanoregulaceae archaeon]|jgi:endonuclease-3|nr:endonuclease III [Methanoregulaceae archaeon]